MTIVPLGLFAGRLVFTSWQQQQDLVNNQNVERARAISVAVDQEVQSTITALNVARRARPRSSPTTCALLRCGLADACRSSRAGMPSGWSIRRSHVVVNTAVPFGDASSLVSDDWVARGARHGSAPRVSSLQRDPATGQFFVSIGVPVMRDSRLRYVLGARVVGLRCSATCSCASRRRPTASSRSMDADLTIVARTRAEELYIGRQPDARLRGRPIRQHTGRRDALDAPRGNAVVLGAQPIAR